MSALARTTEINCDTRAANEDCINGGSRTRTKYAYDPDSGAVSVISGSVPGTAGIGSGVTPIANSSGGIRDADLATAAAAAQNGYNVAAGQARIIGDATGVQSNLNDATYQQNLYDYYMGYSDTMPIYVPSPTTPIAPSTIQITLPNL
jgi:hypothetical protein